MRNGWMLGLLLAGGVTAAAGQEGTLQVCVGADRVLRAEDYCPPETTPYSLALEELSLEPPAEAEPVALQAQVDELRRKLDFMTSHVAELQSALAEASRAGAGGKVVAPFEVVSPDGKPIFRVITRDEGGGFILFNGAGQEVAWGTANASGAFFKTRSVSSFPEVTIGSVGGAGGLVIRDGEQTARATMMLADGKPSVELSNDNHVGILTLRQGASGGGMIEIGDAAGNAMVQAGVTSGGCGRVETYPERAVRAAALGMPADKILGDCP